MIREHSATLTPTLSLSEGEGAVVDPLAPEGGEGQGEGATTMREKRP
jgi:hypothetical protein